MARERLPRGIYYEELRGRYRVRLYKRHRMVYLSYHATLEEAVQAHAIAREAVKHMRVPEPTPAEFTGEMTTLGTQIAALFSRESA